MIASGAVAAVGWQVSAREQQNKTEGGVIRQQQIFVGARVRTCVDSAGRYATGIAQRIWMGGARATDTRVTPAAPAPPARPCKLATNVTRRRRVSNDALNWRPRLKVQTSILWLYIKPKAT
ncbi:hypothetical protein EVAR_39046_1 [Eumeta japonica]|uniref:Uncharacterized protein n=1 Tax=Eumeta variegata TaxID=151549 RepID=A0A4C1WQY7_EUMVA|nr:hypothetical protein EVAR_39046_1 [Eumeta japonica]